MQSMGWVLDLDGVVRLGTRRVTGSPEAIARLRAGGHRVVFATNNSNDTIGQVEQQLAAMGVPATGAVITSATAAATLVDAGERVMVCGGPGVVEAVQAHGGDVIDAGAWDGAVVDTVMVGFSPAFDYLRMTAAVRSVLSGARLVATNDDRTFPTPDGLAPGAGAIVASITAATGVEPIIAGKPHAPMAQAILDRFAEGDGPIAVPSLLVGDRTDTDGAMAAAMGLDFALVLTGVADRSDVVAADEPAFVGEDLAAVVAAMAGPVPVRGRV